MKLLPKTTLWLMCMLLIVNLTAQPSGSAFCSKRKSTSRGVPQVKSANTPKHSFDVIHYALTIDLYNNYTPPYPNTFVASNAITLKADSVISKISLNSESASMVIDSVSPASFSYTQIGDLLQINFNRTYQPGDTVHLTIHYKHNEVEDEGFYCNEGFVFTDSEPTGARRWMPCYDWPSDKATFELLAKVPANVLLASNGLLKDSTKIADTIRYHWTSRDPLSTYLMIITSKADYRLKATYWHPPLHPQDSVPMRFYYNDGEDPQEIIDMMGPMCDFFSNTFTEHPFEKNGFATLNAEFAWGGMENQTLTSLCTDCWQEQLAVHEFAHQWFGDMITCATWADLWINEGFATFCEALWIEHTRGAAAYKNEINNDAAYYLANNSGWAISNSDWAATPPLPNVLFDFAITYQKGACVLAQLRYVMGDTAFFNGLKNYTNDAANFKLNNSTIGDFFAKMEQSSGQDLGWYMDEWIFRANHPLYKIETVLDGNSVTTTLGQTNAEYYKMPVELKYTFFDNSDTLIRTMNEGNNQPYHFTFAKQVTGFQFDPNNQIVLKTVQSNVTKVNDLEDIFGFDLYPNPASETVKLAIRTFSSSANKVELFNSLGQLIFSKNLNAEIRLTTIPLAELPAGIYSVKLSNQSSSVVKPLVITK